MSVTSSRRDLIWAILLFLCSSSIFAATARSILVAERSRVHPVVTVPTGETTWNLLHRGQCIGTASLSLKKDELLIGILKGKLALLSDAGVHEIGIFLSGVFNQLGQLFRTRVRLQLGLGELTATAETINPIELKIVLQAAKINFQYALSVPGPIIATESPDAGVIISAATKVSKVEVPMEGDFEIQQVTPNTYDCSQSSLMPLDMRPYLLQYAQKVQRLTGMLDLQKLFAAP